MSEFIRDYRERMRQRGIANGDPTAREAALVVLEGETLDLMAVLMECGDYTLVERARPDPRLPIMHFIRCPSQLWAERLERSWAKHRLMKTIHGGK